VFKERALGEFQSEVESHLADEIDKIFAKEKAKLKQSVKERCNAIILEEFKAGDR